MPRGRQLSRPTTRDVTHLQLWWALRGLFSRSKVGARLQVAASHAVDLLDCQEPTGVGLSIEIWVPRGGGLDPWHETVYDISGVEDIVDSVKWIIEEEQG